MPAICISAPGPGHTRGPQKTGVMAYPQEALLVKCMELEEGELVERKPPSQGTSGLTGISITFQF